LGFGIWDSGFGVDRSARFIGQARRAIAVGRHGGAFEMAVGMNGARFVQIVYQCTHICRAGRNSRRWHGFMQVKRSERKAGKEAKEGTERAEGAMKIAAKRHQPPFDDWVWRLSETSRPGEHRAAIRCSWRFMSRGALRILKFVVKVALARCQCH
jgi:hypothetical protein